MKFDINFLPARYGDCIWIEYGTNDEMHRILIDGGTSGTKSDIRELIEALPEDQRKFELVVVTHVDRDHIEGILALLEEEKLAFKVEDFWFNGWEHLPEDNREEFGPVQGERLTAAILKHHVKWNKAFDDKVSQSDISLSFNSFKFFITALSKFNTPASACRISVNVYSNKLTQAVN